MAVTIGIKLTSEVKKPPNEITFPRFSGIEQIDFNLQADSNL